MNSSKVFVKGIQETRQQEVEIKEVVQVEEFRRSPPTKAELENESKEMMDSAVMMEHEEALE